MKILCVDEINMDVSSKWVGSFKVTDATIETIKSKVPSTKVSKGDVEGYELSLEQFYKLAVDDIVSSITRQEISRYKTDSIRDQREKIRDVIKKEVLKRLETLKYPLETSDIFCDQSTPPVSAAVTGETATVEFSMLESTAENMKLVLGNFAESEDEDGVAYWLSVGGVTTIAYLPLELEVIDNDTAYLTTWTFFRCLAGGIDANFERENPTAFGVTFTAYADTNHSSGKQLFQVRQTRRN